MTRVGVVGAGFWAGYQLAAWEMQPGVSLVAIANRSTDRAQRLAERFGIGSVYRDADTMLSSERLDVIDIITAPDSHLGIVRSAASHGVPVICQKPLAPTIEEARAAVAACEANDLPIWVHENFRWQAPIRRLHQELRSGLIGRPFRARVEFTTAHPVFERQPGLRRMPRLIVSDVGVHLLDVARFLFGEARTVLAQFSSVQDGIAGEDVATVILAMDGGVTVTCEMSFASRVHPDPFPETLIRIEGSEGVLQLEPGPRLRTTTSAGTSVVDIPRPTEPWLDPDYAVAQAAMVPCIADLLGALRGERPGETTGQDNLRTLELVEAAYRSAASRSLVEVAAVAVPS